MTNKSNSKQHGLVGNIRPKSISSKRARKEKDRVLRKENRKDIPVLH